MTQLNPLNTGLFLHLLFNPIEIFKNEKFFLCLKIAEIHIGGGGQFWVKKNDSGHKDPFFKR